MDLEVEKITQQVQYIFSTCTLSPTNNKPWGVFAEDSQVKKVPRVKGASLDTVRRRKAASPASEEDEEEGTLQK